jgi:hypothetical protein
MVGIDRSIVLVTLNIFVLLVIWLHLILVTLGDLPFKLSQVFGFSAPVGDGTVSIAGFY